MNKCKFSQLFRETYSIKRTNIKLYTSDFPGGSVVVEPLEKSQVPCLNSTGGLTSLLQLKRKVGFHASTRDEV